MNSPALSSLPQQRRLGEASLYRHPVSGEQCGKVFPGKLFCTTDTLLLVTLLGSCVAACIRDPQAGIGGMNHFMLPGGRAGDLNPVGDHRYGQSAMDTLVSSLENLGAQRSRLEIKLFGGGNMLERGAGQSVGENNIAFALNYVEEMGLSVSSQDLGKHCPRKIIYNPISGLVQVNRLPPVYRAMAAENESGSGKVGVNAQR